ncbi:helix-turn-helix domain-containing protein [Streptococcus parauberis]|nr:helix-turn-helix domain-containing protein [Streptococcus parauberis]
MTQQALADKIYVTRQTISKWELGKSIPDQVSLNLLYKELHIETETQKTITQSLFGKDALVLLLSPAVLLLRYGLFNLNQVKDKRLTLLIKCLLTLLLVLYLKSLKDSVFYIACAALFVSYLSYRLYQLSLEKEHKDE